MTERSKLLMVAYEFPPRLSAGVQRTLKFAQHLPVARLGAQRGR